MGLIISKYNNEELIDECWYDSSTIYYSKCYDNKDDYKDIEVTFKDGRTYKYFKVIVQDYLLFREGGLDGSQGKALNSFIKKYQFEKMDKIDIQVLEERKILMLEEKKLEQLKLLEKKQQQDGDE